MTKLLHFRVCGYSVMDTIADPDITFDNQGICNYYYEFQKAFSQQVRLGEEGRIEMERLAQVIRKAGERKPYDCIMGLSGGVDSTYVALIAKELGLRPLAVHFDNGWNSELAVSNIENIVSRLGLDLCTYVINWEEFKDLQLAYLTASVVDIEAITDHAIGATLYKLAGEHGIRYILSGTNVQTENTLPPSWIFPKTDHRNIKAIHKAFGKVPLKTFPFMDQKVKRYYQQVKGIGTVSFLNLMKYDMAEVKKIIQEKLGWKDYGGKHYESVWTRFYQGYILPTKFGIDKRKAHLSDLIFSGQITRDQALAELQNPIYDEKQFQTDYEFVLKKLGISSEDFEKIMVEPRREHKEFDYEMPLEKRYPLLTPLKKLYRNIRPVK